MIVKSYIEALIQSPDGDVTIKFKKEKAKDARKIDIDIEAMPSETEAQKTEKLNAMVERVFRNIISIEGLENDDGTKVTPQDIMAGDTYDDIQAAIIVAYFEARKTKKAPDEQEKKDSSLE